MKDEHWVLDPLGRNYPWGRLAIRGFYIVFVPSLVTAEGRAG
jgi:hypothetical protein